MAPIGAQIRSRVPFIALRVTASMQGCMGIAKSARSVKVLTRCGQGLIDYLEQLRTTQD